MQTNKPHSYYGNKQEVKFSLVKLNSLFSYKGIKYRKYNSDLAQAESPKSPFRVSFSHDTLVTICENKYSAVTVFVDPNNYLSYSLERDDKHTLRFPSKYEYSIYSVLMKYLNKVNRSYPKPRYIVELQFQITLVSKGLCTTAITHVVDFIIRDNQSSINPILYIEAKGKFLKEYVNKMKLVQAIKPQVYSRYCVVSDNEPPNSYTAYYCKADKLEAFLYQMGVK